MLSGAEVEKRFEPSHLIPTEEDLKEQIEKDEEKKEEEINIDDPRFKERYTFKFRWDNGRGDIKSGTFINKILSLHEKNSLVDILRARLCGSLAYEAISPLSNEINFIRAWCQFSLEEKPKWAEDLGALTSEDLIQALYQEVASHEACFHGREEPKGKSTE